MKSDGFFYMTAWQMIPPKPYSAFHLLIGAAGLVSAVLAARFVAGKSLFRREPSRVLFKCGLTLFALELYKQGFLFFVENGGRYDWWYFPFQLCSIPMYLCLIYPHGGRFSGMMAAFIQDFGLLGGVMALLEPSGLMHPYWTMTLHGFLWHFILVFAALFCAFSRITDRSLRGFLETLPLFFGCCLTAILINTVLGPTANADMFYISPYSPSSQVVFHQISLALGIFPGILIYIAAMVLGAFLIHMAVRKIVPGR